VTEIIFSIRILRGLMQHAAQEQQELKKLYAQLPGTRCKRRALCCSLMPEMTLLEALLAIRNICTMKPAKRLSVYRKIVRYFMANPVKIIQCPFLDGDVCLIYKDRFFGCRAYGLWSKEYYGRISENSRQAKRHIRAMWEKMNVCLPKEIVEFQVPYCTDVKPFVPQTIQDDMILSVAESLEILSGQLTPWHDIFRQTYFHDLSFLLTALIFGIPNAISLKFTIVNDVINKGTHARLDAVVNSVQDVFIKLTS
jgi:Fe-S-cluster containining protein